MILPASVNVPETLAAVCAKIPIVKKQIKLNTLIILIIFPFPPSAEVVYFNKQTVKVPGSFDLGLGIADLTIQNPQSQIESRLRGQSRIRTAFLMRRLFL